MSLRSALLAIVLLGTLIHVVSLILIMAALDRRGQKTNFLLARIYAFRYVNAYKEATIKETGKPGVLYRLWTTGIVIALGAALAYVIVRWI
jgi:hypothetical protein